MKKVTKALYRPTLCLDSQFVKLNKIRRYCYQHVRILNTIPNIHYTSMSHDYTIFMNNYFSKINLMRPVVDGYRRPRSPSS